MLVIALSVIAQGFGGRSLERGQPIAYNHRLHTQDLSISCVTCHRGVETAERAGRPSLARCVECHESAITDNPEEHKIQQYAAAGQEIPWRRLTRLPDHVYFSHRRHVVAGKIECGTCHGPMELEAAPPPRALRPIRMSTCMQCHERSGVSNDCNTCHR